MKERTETIRVENLTTGYSDKKRKIAVTDCISSSLYSGELTCLLGQNGAGKSTLLKTLSGFMPPLSGNIFINGKNLVEYDQAGLSRMVGVVLTERISLDNLSVYDLVALGRSPYTGFWGNMDDVDKAVVDEALNLVKIDSLRDRTVATLSDGERQKVMIAKALAQETPVIFLDEPTAFLDYPSKVEIMQLLQKLARLKQKTVFLSTHDLELALQIADNIWLVDKNLGVRTGTPEDLSAEGWLSRYFERDGIVFDPETGLFKIENNPSRHIVVKGSGIRCKLLGKALRRNGFKPVDNDMMVEYTAETDGIISDEIIVFNDCYGFKGKSFPSIGSLLQELMDGNARQ